MGNCGAGDEVYGFDVHGHNPVPDVLGRVVDGMTVEDAGVVDDDIETAELPDDGADRGLYFFGYRNVDREVGRAAG